MNDNIIAPGTSNEVLFKIDNTTKRVFYYSVKMNAYFSDNEITLPIEVSLKRYDGVYVFGSNDESKLINDFVNVQDDFALKPDRYSYYTFKWEWPFESGNDELDTLLGNISANEPLTLTVELEFVEELANITKEYNETLTQKVAHFSTNVADSTGGRKHNVKSALEKFNGFILEPGKEVSFNEVTGPHTLENGYKIATIIFYINNNYRSINIGFLHFRSTWYDSYFST